MASRSYEAFAALVACYATVLEVGTLENLVAHEFLLLLREVLVHLRVIGEVVAAIQVLVNRVVGLVFPLRGSTCLTHSAGYAYLR